MNASRRHFEDPMRIFGSRTPMARLAVAVASVALVSNEAPAFDGGAASMDAPLAQTTRFGISPFYGYRFGGQLQDPNTENKYSIKDSPSFGVVLDYAPPGYFARFEALWSHQDSSIDFEGSNGLGSVDLTVDVIQAGAVAEFGWDRFRPYLSAHVGATHYAYDAGGSDTKFSFGFGAGVKAYLTRNLYLRADLRGYCTIAEAEGGFIFVDGVTVATFSGSTLWQGEASVGLGITF